MTDHHMRPAYKPEPPHSMNCPSYMAMYLHSLIKAAEHLVHHLEAPAVPGFASANEMGLPGLMTVICERADALSQMLEHMDPEGWAIAQEALQIDRQESHARAMAAFAAKA